jgi:hypothetical protein
MNMTDRAADFHFFLFLFFVPRLLDPARRESALVSLGMTGLSLPATTLKLEMLVREWFSPEWFSPIEDVDAVLVSALVTELV